MGLVEPLSSAKIQALMFAAHDRHNFGDLLFAHVAAHYLRGRTLLPVGLIARDLSAVGGFRLEAIGELSRRHRTEAVELFHVGGEILTTTAWQAAVMLAEPSAVAGLVARFDDDPAGASAYAAQCFGFASAAPYVAGRELFPAARRIVFNAVGGADLAEAPATLREEVLGKLRQADCIYVRDRITQAALAAADIAAALAPDPAAIVGELFGERIAMESRQEEAAAARRRFSQGYLAVQFSADCGDDKSLSQLAGELDRIASATGWGVVFFRAGAAPWHDELEVYRRCAARLTRAESHIFENLGIWQIAALIAASQGFLGASLHGRIVAAAFALPRVNFLPPSLEGGSDKLTAYCATWEMPQMPGVVPLARLAEGFFASRQVPWAARRAHAARLAALYHRAAEKIFAP